jgi:hypothetical protein
VWQFSKSSLSAIRIFEIKADITCRPFEAKGCLAFKKNIAG